jgi:hypothetical protein
LLLGLLVSGLNCAPVATQPKRNDVLIKTAAGLYRDNSNCRQEQILGIIRPLPSG